MIKISDVSYKYSSGEEHAIENINLNIKQGELVLLLGPSGSGKTTITRLINGLIPDFYEGEMKGKVVIDGKDIGGLLIQDIAHFVGSVFQDPRSQFFATDTTAEIAFSCENISIPMDEINRRISKSVKDLNIKRLLNQSLFELSSGEKQLIAIASVYAYSPRILVMDEPSANLDMRYTKRLGEIIRNLKNQGITIVISEHRIHYLKDYADQIICLKEGRIANRFSGEEFRELTNQQANKLGLRSLDLPSLSISNINGNPLERDFFSINNISFKFKKEDWLLKDISFSVEAGEILGIVGDNGIGKTTLLELICGLQKEKSGIFTLRQKRLRSRKRIKTSYLVMQDSDYQLFTESVEKELYLGNKGDESLKEQCKIILNRLDLEDFIQRHPASLSGGQKQRLCIAVAYMKNADVVCFDEPTSGLDYNSMKNITKLFREMASTGKSIVLTSHDYEFLLSACTHICHIKGSEGCDTFSLDNSTTTKLLNILDLHKNN
jgi:energy-coupling factor transport system ATP-binding protein